LVVLALGVASCRQTSPPAEATADELPTLDVTHFTEAAELFMEHPPLVSGQPALFAIHLTKLADFAPVSAGRVSVELTPQSGGQPTVLVGPKPARPGAFRVEEAPPAPGRYRWALVIDAPGLQDRHDLGTITVFPDEKAARGAAGEGPSEDASAIAYLKEQQWVNPFATALAQEAEVRASVRAPAVIQPLPGGEALVTTPAAGRFVADERARTFSDGSSSSSNVAGRDLGGVVADMRAGVANAVALPQGYRIEYGGQFEGQQSATERLLVLGAATVIGVFMLLVLAFGRVREALLVMLNLPLALIGGVVGVSLAGGVLNVASMIGFITLFGIATRNGIMLVSHVHHLMREEGVSDFREAVERGARARVVPILMTATAAGLALIPLAAGGGKPGSEIQTPMAIVILSGLVSSTLLNMVVVPALYLRYARPKSAASTAGSTPSAGC
jgi:hypothetical protein